jgi:uncharacterized protein (DUF427 family)
LSSALETAMAEPGSDHPITITPNPNRVRVVLGGVIVAETTRALTLKEADLPPVQYIPREDVRMDLFDRTHHASHCPHKGDATYAWSYEQPYPAAEPIRDCLAFYPSKVDAIEELRG